MKSGFTFIRKSTTQDLCPPFTAQLSAIRRTPVLFEALYANSTADLTLTVPYCAFGLLSAGERQQFAVSGTDFFPSSDLAEREYPQNGLHSHHLSHGISNITFYQSIPEMWRFNVNRSLVYPILGWWISTVGVLRQRITYSSAWNNLPKDMCGTSYICRGIKGRNNMIYFVCGDLLIHHGLIILYK